MNRSLSPRDARDRFLSRRKQENTERTVRSYRNRLTRFVEWAEEHGIEEIGQVSGWELDEYRAAREAADVAPVTLRGQMMAVKQLMDYCESIGVVDDDLGEKVPIPKVSQSDETSDVQLEHEDALDLLSFYRTSRKFYGRPEHAFLEVAWHVGARMGGIRSLDLRDFDRDAQTLHFQHRPETGTGLKNKTEGERIVGVSSSVVDVLRSYIARERFDIRDEHGREPLFCARQGRPSDSTFRAWSYMGTQPCVRVLCPHGNQREACKFTRRNYSSQCPSSRSPHAVRTGSITWQLLQGLEIETVAKRVNASPQTIRRYYYKATELEDFEKRRADVTLKLDIENDEN